MYKVIKNKGKIVKAYQLGDNSNEIIKNLISDGKIINAGDGSYRVFSREIMNGENDGEIAAEGDWIKIDSNGFPYPNKKDFFEANHRHIDGDTFEQIPKALLAWDSNLEMCPEVTFLVEKKGLIIDEKSVSRRYSAELWGTTEVADAEAKIVFYKISYAGNGDIEDIDYNFIASDEFEKTYSIVK